MADITPVVNSLLEKLSCSPIHQKIYSYDHIDGFLQEAYSINSRVAELLVYLRTVRPSYLSNAPPPRRNASRSASQKPKDSSYLSNNQRDAIDAEAKSTLRDINAAITSLSEVESIREKTQTALAEKRRRKRGFGALGQWAAGGSNNQKSEADETEDARQNGVNACREGVIWFLQRHLETCSKVQGHMMETRITSELEKNRNALSMAKGTLSFSQKMPGRTASDTTSMQPSQVAMEELEQGTSTEEQQLSEEQMQLFQQENKDMLKLYSDRLDQVRTAEKSLLEISELQGTLAANLEVQSAQIEQLVGDSLYAEENVGGGNKQLRKASERESTAKMVCYGTCIGCLFFAAWDLIF